MTIEEIIARAEADKLSAERRASDAEAARDAAMHGPGGASPRAVAQAVAERRAAAEAVRDADSRLQVAREIQADNATVAGLQRESYPTGIQRPGAANRGVASLQIGRNERTYRPDTDKFGRGFLMDVAANFMSRDPSAGARLERHMAEHRIDNPGFTERAAGDSTTSSFVGLVVPQYLTDMYAPSIAPMRPFADNCNHHDLPEQGMTINLSLVTTPSSVGLVATELPAGNVSATSLNDTLLTENVQTVSGQQTVSRQAIERGAGIEDVTVQDLLRHLATTLDSTLINQAVTGVSALATVNTWTQASPTAQLLYPLLYGANSLCEQALYGIAVPDLVLMASRRFNWMVSSLGTSWPLFGAPGVPAQSGGLQLTNDYGSRIRAVLPNGLRVCVDGSVPTNLGVGNNQDEIYVAASEECHLWEPPGSYVMIRAEQPKAPQLGILYVVYQYFAYSFRRFGSASIQKISGTGLVAPAGF